MHHSQRFLIFCLTLTLAFWQCSSIASSIEDKPPVTDKVEAVLAKVTPRLAEELADKEFRLGAPVFIRIFKLPAQLEVWLEKNERYELFRSYPVCDFSGYPGPKLREGDWQSPEGFYTVSADRMNPRSSYHLSFNIGYPNEYDRYRHRSGSNIMVHGSCSSMGCFAMNDSRMEEIYALAHAALSNSQESFAVHIFPFRMTADNMNKFRSSPWIGFWQNLKEGFDAFEQTGQVPEIRIAGGRYVVNGTIRVAMKDNRQ
ncbi:MAG TPA: murein L,D-transpeptidase [Desulfobacteraceae bacterium]|nr:murein L,D-transpeptidase [Desulfobacteraceae bacterium]